uniref:uncharacterized protein LOC120327551 isoform X2 n=1 Tax=Styela clava TaxID=7725 RepID=UPI00193944DB|nr:uncharacterized protein LOC120327551 isoform X2 [Styela clava]
MDNLNKPSFDMSEISLSGFLNELVVQDKIFWEKKGNVEDNECLMTKHGNSVSDIHDHFRKLEPEYCSRLSKDSISGLDSTVRQNSTPAMSITNTEHIVFDITSSDEDDKIDSSAVRPSTLLRQSSRPMAAPRRRHCSEGNSFTPRRPSILESLALGRSPRMFAVTGPHDSTESLQSRGSDTSKYETVSKSSELHLYRAASLCCSYSILYSNQSKNPENEFSHLNVLPAKDYNRSMADRLLEYLRLIFNISEKKHRQYQVIDSSQKKSKREILDQNLHEQLRLLETDSHPYYSPANFQSDIDHKIWQDKERQQINVLLGGRIPKSSRQRHTANPRNRCHEYRDILKKVIVFDVEETKRHVSSNESLTNGNYSDSSYGQGGLKQADIISKCGKRLLGEFAERHRVGIVTQLCFYLQLADDCIENEILQLDNLTFTALTNKLDMLYSLLEEENPLCISEMEILLYVTANFIQRVKNLVTNLLTDWLPTTKELQNGLQLARASFQLQSFLHGVEDSEWPTCLSSWFESATIQKYCSCRKPKFTEIETVLASVTHAVDVLKIMQKGRKSVKQTDYEAVFSNYIPNFPHAVSNGLYDAVMADVKLLDNALSLMKSTLVWRQNNPYNDSLDLNDIALAYKLNEFDNLVKIREINAIKQFHHERKFSWRKAYHQLAMHWLDILSVHMRKQVSQAVSKDKFDSPLFNDDFTSTFDENMFSGTQDDKLNASGVLPSKRMRMGSLLRKDADMRNEILVSAGPSNLEVVVEHDPVSEDSNDENIPENSNSSSVTETNCTENDVNREKEDAQFPPQSLTHPIGRKKDRSSSEPVLLSYKPILDSTSQEDSSRTTSFRSCISGESPTMYRSVTDSTAKVMSTSASHTDFSINETGSSTAVSDEESPTLPILTPTKFLPQKEAISDDVVSNASENFDDEEPNSEMNDTLCNVSSSLIDFISVISRFTNFVKTIMDTVYSLPPVADCQNRSALPSSIEDHANCRDARELKERFVQKAFQALGVVIQQYANNLLNIDLESISRQTAEKVIGEKFYRHIIDGKFNKTISQQHSVVESYLNIQDETVWVEDVKKNIIRLNDLLVLEHGMTEFWNSLKILFSPELHDNVAPPSFPLTEESHSSIPVIVPGDFHSITSETDDNAQEVSSSDATLITSSGACTIVRHDEDIQNNNDNNSDLDLNDQDNSDKKKENVDLLSGAWTIIDAPEQDFTPPCFVDILKERTESHLKHTVRGVSRLFALHISQWIGYFLDEALGTPNTKSLTNNHSSSCLNNLTERLILVLDLLATWTHKEGVKNLHESIWCHIIQDIQDRICELKTVEENMKKIYAKHIRKVYTTVIDTWYHHYSKPNGGDLDWLSKDIQPSLTILDLYCMPTLSLVGVYNECRHEQNKHMNDLSYLNIRHQVVLCMRVMQDKKSFSGELLHHTLLTTVIESFSTVDEARNEANKLCQEMLNVQLIEFVFKKQRRPHLPDLIPVQSISVTVDDSLVKNRAESDSTGSSSVDSENSLESEESSFSTDSEMRTEFHPDSDHFYKFSEKRLPLSILDDVKRATDCPTAEEASFLEELLLKRSSADRDAKLFLIEKGLLKRGVFGTCFLCFR